MDVIMYCSTTGTVSIWGGSEESLHRFVRGDGAAIFFFATVEMAEV